MSVEAASPLFSERMLIVFESRAKQYTMITTECVQLARKTIDTANTSAVKFSNIVATRSLVYEKPTKWDHEIANWTHKGPFSAEQFLQMMQHSPTCSNDEWRAHMTGAAGITTPPPLRRVASSNALPKITVSEQKTLV